MPNFYQKNYPVDKDYPDIADYHNCMAKSLTPQLYAAYRDVATPLGFTFDQVIQTGVDNPGHPNYPTAGCVAGDEDCYTVFQGFFDRVIAMRHDGYGPDCEHITDHHGSHLTNAHLDSKYVLHCRVRTGRTIKGLPMPPHCTRAERRHVEKILTDLFSTLGEHFAGTYHPIFGMAESVKKELMEENVLFDKPTSPLLLSTDMARDWPDARGIWHNKDKNFIAWVNVEDHLRIISLAKDGNMTAVFQRFCDGLSKIEAALHAQDHSFAWTQHLGYILSCPSNLGTGMRASVHITLPKLAEDPRLDDIVYKLRLQKHCLCDSASSDCAIPTAISRYHMPTPQCGPTIPGLFDICNADRLGFSEVHQVQLVVDGVGRLIDMEKRLEKGESIDDLLPAERVTSVNGHRLSDMRASEKPDDDQQQKQQGEPAAKQQDIDEIVPNQKSANSIQAQETEV